MSTVQVQNSVVDAPSSDIRVARSNSVGSITELSQWTRDKVLPVLRESVGTLRPPVLDAAEYQFGWRDADGSEFHAYGGKLLRPMLVLLAAHVVSEIDDAVLRGAAAVETVHNFSLLHDDVMDNDRLRRGRPTTWAIFGEATAILVGDALLALAFQTLFRIGGSRALAAATMLEETTQDLVLGQALDIDFEKRDFVGIERCEEMIAGKTGSLLACAAGIGGILSGADTRVVSGLRSFGMHLGIAFQITDDLIGIYGQESVTGKPVGSDIRRRKLSVPVVGAMHRECPEAKALRDLYRAPRPLSDDDVANATCLIEQAGGREWAAQRAASHASLAVAALADTPMPHAVRAKLHALADFASSRDC